MDAIEIQASVSMRLLSPRVIITTIRRIISQALAIALIWTSSFRWPSFG